MAQDMKSEFSGGEPVSDATLPSEFDARIEQWRRRAGRVNAEAVQRILENQDTRALLFTIFQNTNYLSDCCLQHPDAVIEALQGEPARVLSDVARDLRALDRATGHVSVLSRAIRPLKERGIVATALADVSGRWTVERVGASLADLGERALDAGLSWLIRMSIRHGDIIVKKDMSGSSLPGLFVLGGGDFSVGAAHYCGPLECAVIYDLEALNEAGVTVSERTLQRIAEQLRDAFRATQDSPAVFELDLARFNGGSEAESPLALPVSMAAERLGEASEARARAWFAHARVVAGDRAAGAKFLDDAGWRLWRDGLSATDIKAAVAAETGCAADPVWRLAQTCRLALGTRHEDVRLATPHMVFETAAKLGALDAMTAARLGVNADFRWTARNRRQLIDGRAYMDEANERERAQRALLCGYSRLDLFDKVLAGCVAEAEQQWYNIIEPASPAGVAMPEPSEGTTSARLEELGFTHGKDIAATVDNWIVGRYGAGDPTTGRRRLSEVAPGLLTEIANTQRPDDAVLLFDRLLTSVPAEVDPFKVLSSNPAIMSAIVDLLGNATQFGEMLCESTQLIEEIFLGTLEIPETPDEWFECYPPPSPAGELSPEYLAALTRWSRENRARLVYATFTRGMKQERTGLFAAAFAERTVRTLYDTMNAGASEPARGLAVVALGDFGGRDLVCGAPIDLAFVYDPSTPEGVNDRARSIYMKRAAELAQAITGEKEHTGLYDIDTRKRPFGASSDIATEIGVYLNFYQNEAHPEEHVDLTRARVICGPQNLKERLEAAISDCVTRPRKAERLMIEADKGRAKQTRRNRPSSIWDVERIRGGLGELNFIAEILQVRFGAEHPYVLAATTSEALAGLARAGCLDPDTATDLKETHLFFSRLRSMLMLTGAGDLSRDRPRKRLQALVARAAGVTAFGSVEPLIQGHAERVQAHYKRLILGDESASAIQKIIAA